MIALFALGWVILSFGFVLGWIACRCVVDLDEWEAEECSCTVDPFSGIWNFIGCPVHDDEPRLGA